MTADTSHNDNNENDEIGESSRKHLLIGVILGIILLGIVLNRSGFISFEKNKGNPNPPTNSNIDDVTDPGNTENAVDPKVATLYERFTKKPKSYYQYDAEELKPEFVEEAFIQFKTWLEGGLPGTVDDPSAKISLKEVPRIDDQFIINKASTFPKKVNFPESWKMISTDSDSALCIVIPPSKSPLPSEYWIKFILLKDNVGKVYSFSLMHSKKKGFVWKFTGISFE